MSHFSAAPESAAALAALVREAPERFGLPHPSPGARVRVRLLGQGESYTAWLLTGGAAVPLVLRVPRRPVSELPRPMGQEFAALSAVPDGMGPAPVRFEADEDNPLGTPYLVTGYIPGRERPSQAWDDRLLTAHVRQMARLHGRIHDRRGPIGAAPGDAPPARETPGSASPHPSPARPGVSLTDDLADGLSWWREARPDVLADPEVSRLLPRVVAFVGAAAPAFARLERFVLVHGDLVVPNVLVDGAGRPRYIDWEWAEIGDPAQDLAYIGGYVAAPPWYVPLDRRRIRGLLVEYLRRVAAERTGAAADGGCADSDGPEGPDALADLEIRRDAWEVYERFLSSLHFRTRRGTPEDRRSGRYTHAVARLTAGLESRLG
ncbi:phosphotransferase [Streptomyces sp. NPDC003077]|uniref:phosphotransferase family protein n=1 Tax=Streptomyces sp. NPDC003077 TaxID=3154443 RepID=UPI0033A8E863